MSKENSISKKEKTATIEANFVRETKNSFYLSINGNYDSWDKKDCSYDGKCLTAPMALLKQRFPNKNFE